MLLKDKCSIEKLFLIKFDCTQVMWKFLNIFMFESAFLIKWAQDYVYTHKILHPHNFEKWLHELEEL